MKKNKSNRKKIKISTKKTLKTFLEPTLTNDERLTLLKKNSQHNKLNFCKSLNYDDCTDENSFCSYSSENHCFYNPDQEQQFIDSINYQCYHNCQCPEERPYEYTYRGKRKYCTNNLKTFNLIYLESKAYRWTELSSIRKKLKKDGLLGFLKKTVPSLFVGTISGIAKQFLSRVINLYCHTYLNQKKWLGIDKNYLEAANSKYSIMKENFIKDVTSMNFKTKFENISKGVFWGYFGAQEEYLFRSDLSDYTQSLKPKIFKLMRKFNFSDKVTIKNVNKIYFLFDMVITGVLFGLVHLTNLEYNKNIKSVLCQVVFTTLGSWIFYFLAKFDKLRTAWFAHFSHNFFAFVIPS